ncbi:MAG: hypothetical protein ACM3TT_05880 [Syntrophothermus sp.]
MAKRLIPPGILVFIVIALAILALAVTTSAAAPSGLDGKGACAACHISDNKDYSLPAEARKASPAHPDLDKLAAATGIKEWTVKECLTCHGASESRIAFKTVLHKAHLSSKVFTPKYGGSCVTCHAVTKEGEIVLRYVTDKPTVPFAAETLEKAPFIP